MDRQIMAWEGNTQNVHSNLFGCVRHFRVQQPLDLCQKQMCQSKCVSEQMFFFSVGTSVCNNPSTCVSEQSGGVALWLQCTHTHTQLLYCLSTHLHGLEHWQPTHRRARLELAQHTPHLIEFGYCEV